MTLHYNLFYKVTMVAKKRFEENTFVIAFDTNRYYKAKILKSTPMKSSWK